MEKATMNIRCMRCGDFLKVSKGEGGWFGFEVEPCRECLDRATDQGYEMCNRNRLDREDGDREPQGTGQEATEGHPVQEFDPRAPAIEDQSDQIDHYAHDTPKSEPGLSGIEAVFGKWPGDETDEQLTEALRDRPDPQMKLGKPAEAVRATTPATMQLDWEQIDQELERGLAGASMPSPPRGATAPANCDGSPLGLLGEPPPPVKRGGAKPDKSNGRVEPPAPRPRNLIWDALCTLFSLEPVTKADRSRVGRLSLYFAQKGATPNELAIRLVRYREEWPDMADTPEALLKQWERFANPKVQPERRPDGCGQTKTERATVRAGAKQKGLL